jgi:hypothetical protein
MLPELEANGFHSPHRIQTNNCTQAHVRSSWTRTDSRFQMRSFLQIGRAGGGNLVEGQVFWVCNVSIFLVNHANFGVCFEAFWPMCVCVRVHVYVYVCMHVCLEVINGICV